MFSSPSIDNHRTCGTGWLDADSIPRDMATLIRYLQSEEADRRAAQGLLNSLCRSHENNAAGVSRFVHAVVGARVEGNLGDLPKPCQIVDVPGFNDENRSRQEEVLNQLASPLGHATHHWLVSNNFRPLLPRSHEARYSALAPGHAVMHQNCQTSTDMHKHIYMHICTMAAQVCLRQNSVTY